MFRKIHYFYFITMLVEKKGGFLLMKMTVRFGELQKYRLIDRTED